MKVLYKTSVKCGGLETGMCKKYLKDDDFDCPLKASSCFCNASTDIKELKNKIITLTIKEE